MIYKYSYILCRFIDSQNYKNDCYFQSFRRKNRYAARREQMIGRHNEPGFYSVLTGLFVAAAVEILQSEGIADDGFRLGFRLGGGGFGGGGALLRGHGFHGRLL